MLNRVIKQKTLRSTLTNPRGNEALLSERILTGRTFSALPYSRLVNLSLHVVSVKKNLPSHYSEGSLMVITSPLRLWLNL